MSCNLLKQFRVNALLLYIIDLINIDGYSSNCVSRKNSGASLSRKKQEDVPKKLFDHLTSLENWSG